MWILNTDTNIWERKTDSLNVNDFNSLKEDYLKIEYLKRKCIFKFPFFYDGNNKICLHEWIFLVAPDNINEILTNNIYLNKHIHYLL
jgi:hypothetical protein